MTCQKCQLDITDANRGYSYGLPGREKCYCRDCTRILRLIKDGGLTGAQKGRKNGHRPDYYQGKSWHGTTLEMQIRREKFGNVVQARGGIGQGKRRGAVA